MLIPIGNMFAKNVFELEGQNLCAYLAKIDEQEQIHQNSIEAGQKSVLDEWKKNCENYNSELDANNAFRKSLAKTTFLVSFLIGVVLTGMHRRMDGDRSDTVGLVVLVICPFISVFTFIAYIFPQSPQGPSPMPLFPDRSYENSLRLHGKISLIAQRILQIQSNTHHKTSDDEKELFQLDCAKRLFERVLTHYDKTVTHVHL